MKNDFSGFAKHQKEKLDKYFKKNEELTFKKIPVGFIHNQDEEYYYYSFDGNCLGYEDIVKKFVEECLI